MSLGKITMGNMKDVLKSIREKKAVCVVYDRESAAAVRNFIGWPDEEEKNVQKLLQGNIRYIEFSDELYMNSLELYAKYDIRESLPVCCIREKEQKNKPSLSFCSQDSLKYPVKCLAWLQATFDIVYLV